MLISCQSCPVCDNSPNIKIPDLPSSVKRCVTKIPKGPLNKKQNYQLIKDYAVNETCNVSSVDTAISSHKKLQEVYGK